MLDALWQVLSAEKIDLQDILIFLPSRRAVRSVEKFLVEKSGHSIILPKLVALGEGTDDEDLEEVYSEPNIISNTERLVLLARLLAADVSVGNMSVAIPIAHDLLRMQDYLENEGVNISDINWAELVDEKYAMHFQHKAKLLSLLAEIQSNYGKGRTTEVASRNADIRNWIKHLCEYKLVVVCGSTASVPATADLMAEIAKLSFGRIILSGKISGTEKDFEIDSNPYNSENKFLHRIEASVSDLIPIEVGKSAIDFFNYAFSNNPMPTDLKDSVSHCHLIECARESEEANVVAEIASRAVAENKSVLVITPDAAGNQRIASALNARGVSADFSGGTSGTMTPAGRAILNVFDDWIEQGNTQDFDKLYSESNNNLLETIVKLIDESGITFSPVFDIEDTASLQIWQAIKNISDCLLKLGIKLSLLDARAFLADAIKAVSVRNQMDDSAKVVVLGTIESRMQTADVVILTGLNEGMFPARGYENAWLPRDLASKIGLPSPDRKVSLQALDFMNLSCGGEVYWLRSRVSGGVQTVESRFLSRVMARAGTVDFEKGKEILLSVRAMDDVAQKPLDYSAPNPPADWSDVYVTELELLIHNPYAFYARHILRLYPMDDYWALPDARQFGNLVHSVIENAKDLAPEKLVKEMDAQAISILGADSVIFHFWHKRFVEIAPVVSEVLAKLKDSKAEIGGLVNIAGRNVRARADRIWDGGVMDIKTGAAPSKKQLLDGNMPQLPLEAYILQNGGFPLYTTKKSQLPTMLFLQLKNRDVRPIEYDAETTAQMISAAVEKTTDLFNMFSAGQVPYEYRETGDRKYKAYDDLARVDD